MSTSTTTPTGSLIGTAFVAEYRKLVTTRLWWILLLCMAAYMAFLAGVLGWALTQAPDQATGGMGGGGEAVDLTPESVVRTVYTIAVSFGYVFPLLVGTLAMTSEFRYQTITPTLLTEPSRTRLLVAKLGSNGVLGALFGAVGTLACVAVGGGLLALLGESTFLGDADTWVTLAKSVLALAVWALVGVALGSVLTHQVAAIVVVLAFTQFVEPVLRVVLAFTSWGKDIAMYLPGAAGEAISGGSFYAATGVVGMLEWWQGLGVLLAYVAVLAGIGRATTLRRDIT